MPTSISIELFSTSGCNRCVHVKQRLENMVTEFGKGTIAYREVDVLKELDYAVSLAACRT
jgi:predicted DsbA family dithiol-disulfide isomerase